MPDKQENIPAGVIMPTFKRKIMTKSCELFLRELKKRAKTMFILKSLDSFEKSPSSPHRISASARKVDVTVSIQLCYKL